MANKKRLDLAVFDGGYAESREKAKALIMAGKVFVNNQKCTKAGEQIKDTDVLDVRLPSIKYVSRGGLKLEKAISEFNILLDGLVCMDIGASTGGFTDCMLQNNAKKVYSIDVGYGQLDWKLRSDERVINLERTNFRHLTTADVPQLVDFASVDVSFISLKLILPVLFNFLLGGGQAVCLIKPQFEAGRGNVGKKGVVRDKAVHHTVVESIAAFAVQTGFTVKALSFSPIKGPQGNIEYLMHIVKEDNPELAAYDLDELINKSHEELV